MTEQQSSIKLPGTPKPWMNASMSTMLKIPGLRSVLGRSLMLLTVTGAKTGRRYTTPVQYVRDGDRMLVLSQRKRRWWRNVRERPEVELLLKGNAIRAVAHLSQGDEAREAIVRCLRLDPRLAKFYRIELDENGEPAGDGVQQLVEAFIVIVIEPSSQSGRW